MTNNDQKQIDSQLNFTCRNHLDSVILINAILTESENLSSMHYQKLAELYPQDQRELLQLAQVEALHAEQLNDCVKQQEANPDGNLVNKHLTSIHNKFVEAERNSDVLNCFVIQCLLIESFLISTYLLYLRVANDYTSQVLGKILNDEFNHIEYGEKWFKKNSSPIADDNIIKCIKETAPIILGMIHTMRFDMKSIGIDPKELMIEFITYLKESLVEIGFSRHNSRKLVRSIWTTEAMAKWEGWPYRQKVESLFKN